MVKEYEENSPKPISKMNSISPSLKEGENFGEATRSADLH